MKYYTVNGYFSKSDAESIKAKLDGKTYMNFHVEISNMAGNCQITVSSDYPETEEELRDMFFWFALGELARKYAE